MQKPVEGLLEKMEDRVAIGEETAQKHVENYIKRGYRLLRAQQFKRTPQTPTAAKTNGETNTTIYLFPDQKTYATPNNETRE
jgi:hypothetical protein